MPCYFPLRGYRSLVPNANGKYPIIFTARNDDSVRQVEVPCGQCIGCRLDRSRKWAIRCVNEASLYQFNCFVTLTYDNEYLPVGGTLVLRHAQLFMKRLRKRYGSGIRFFMCGEYGDVFKRPHYHYILFNHDFFDKELIRVKPNNLYSSRSLCDLWPYGFSSVGAVSFESSAYVARYCLKKITGSIAETHYCAVDSSTGELFSRLPEFSLASRRPGIGNFWFAKFRSDVFPSDFQVSRGIKVKPPRYYDNLYEVDRPDVMAQVREIRRLRGFDARMDSTLKRLKVREAVAIAKSNLSKRSVE